ncbi:MAG: DUF3159 domain-containing protein [Micromonosporaceae bacterium]|nr:DUF3159 domain-containing protein [Micromonosporaceae bacterium]
MTSREAGPAHSADEERLPTFSEQVASQLGGVRGTVEAGIPIVVFVVVNLLWSLRPALVAAVAVALGIGAYRLWRRESVRHAANGLVGIVIGAALAWRSGEAKDVYLPGILYTAGYCVALLGSVVIGRPFVGWLWSVIADNGGTRWYREEGLRRIFAWLTLVWSASYLIKLGGYLWVFYDSGLTDDQQASILGILRIALGAPLYGLLLALTIWAVRRHQRGLGNAVPA